jgi:hypothetical protein
MSSPCNGFTPTLNYCETERLKLECELKVADISLVIQRKIGRMRRIGTRERGKVSIRAKQLTDSDGLANMKRVSRSSSEAFCQLKPYPL